MTWDFQEMNISYINKERVYRVQNSHYNISTDCNTFVVEYNSLAFRSSAREPVTHKMKMVHNAESLPFNLVQENVGHPSPRHENI